MFGFLLDMMAAVGMGHPVSRAVSLACVGFAFQYFVKPKISYVVVPQDGKGKTTAVAKEFYLTSNSTNANAKTWFPWYMWPAAAGLLGGLFL